MQSELDHIIENNLNRIWPNILPHHRSILKEMLRNRPVEKYQKNEDLFQLFDTFFSKYSGEAELNTSSLKYREQIKLYYLPQLFFRKPAYSTGYFLKTIGRYPLLAFDSKFIKNICKLAIN